MFSGIKKAISKIKEKIATTTLDEKDLDKALWEFEINLVENNVSEEIAQRIVRDIKSALLNKKVPRFTKIEEIIDDVFKNLIEETFRQLPKYDLIKMIKDKQEKPFVIVFIGINGNGKTTSIAKLCYKLKNEYNLKCLLACSDTFRAGAIEQLEKHAKNLNVEYIKHKYGASPTAVAYSAVEYAYNKKI
ncbi:MAG: signal recognition particle receptor subunit alpha, partial [Thermoproteota archaeon]|nr:signal recognition particle receptor subunit alpha [Thermoproteota archaeon]